MIGVADMGVLDPPTLKSRMEKEEVAEEDDDDEDQFPSLRKFCLNHQEIVEPLLMFCTHGIRMRDTRSCSMILRLFISIVPEFSSVPGQPSRKPALQQDGRGGTAPVDKTPVPDEIATAIREYMSQDVLKACVTSFHEPYFVEVQKELASLIGTILVYYGPITNTPRDVLLSLPDVNPGELDRLAPYMAKPGSHLRQQRAIVMELLKDLKGVSVSEMGKLPKSSGFGQLDSRGRRTNRSKMAQEFMNAPPPTGATRAEVMTGGQSLTSDPIEGVSNLFGE